MLKQQLAGAADDCALHLQLPNKFGTVFKKWQMAGGIVE
jgi:hypothetical protein